MRQERKKEGGTGRMSRAEEEEGKREDRGVMRGTAERRTTTTLIKEEKSSIKQQTVRVCVCVWACVCASDTCVFVHSSGCRAVVCTS